MNVVYNKTRVAKTFKNELTFEGAELAYFLSKKHTVVLRRGADEPVIARLETIEQARATWSQWQDSLKREGFSRID